MGMQQACTREAGGAGGGCVEGVVEDMMVQNQDLRTAVNGSGDRQYEHNIVNRAKLKCRSDLEISKWSCGRYWEREDCTREVETHGEIARVRAEEMSVEDFYKQFEIPNIPVCIDGIVQKWPAWSNWTYSKLYRRYRHHKFRVGDDDDGYAVRIKLKYFLRYMVDQCDDSPLYIFDSRFPKKGGDKGSRLLDDYEVPEYFQEDLFHLIGEKRRPPYRWFLLGPKRSGSSVHIDPLGTSAWNALISGRKRWILFPPHVSKKVVKAKHLIMKGEDDEPIDYFTNILPRLKRSMGDALDYVEFIQYPGETVFIPGGWWHAVVNLDDTVAVTQNFVSSHNFRNCWYQTRKGRRGMARKWYRELQKVKPHLAAIVDEMNSESGYVLQQEREKHHAEYKRHVVGRRFRTLQKKRERAVTGQVCNRSSSSSGDLVDSDWTSLSESFEGLNTSDEELISQQLVESAQVNYVQELKPPPLVNTTVNPASALPGMNFMRGETAPLNLSRY